MRDHSTGKSIGERVHEFEGSVRALGLRIPSGSTVDARLRAARRYAEQNQAAYDPDLYLVGEFLQLANAVAALPATIDLAKHWGRVIQGKDFYPKFLELVVASRLARFGQEVTDAEPDIRLMIGNAPFLIACKCLTSEKRVLPAIVDARAQIVRQGFPGFVLIELSRIVELDGLGHGLDENRWMDEADRRCKIMLRGLAAGIQRALTGTLAKSAVFKITRTVPTMFNAQVTLSTLDYFLNVRVDASDAVMAVIELLGRPDDAGAA